MESLFFSLLQVLTELNENLTAMLRATEAHNQALRANDMTTIKEVLKELDPISKQVRTFDTQREAIQASLEERLQLPKGSTLNKTLQHAPVHLVQDLNKVAQSLTDTTEAIQKIVEINNVLTKQALHFNEVLLNTMRPAKSTYNPTGQTSGNKPSTSILNKTI
ncbi:hypothetical protein Dred_2437 [Desulforamulus reducens MI-1]|uniref:FlgN family protein n=1 Tax=Desulforamulus reducens (strain ATCC BAA-1160 / DSM 100696 / MI-1) TaxID=349161 RepID=A4J794_DESRM|nr:flagellar protein FlgN [Desulforamulus reducens]ABO50947.1 hypothetical protein Dred_2437 [Desulforamulus reducens MI-1]